MWNYQILPFLDVDVLLRLENVNKYFYLRFQLTASQCKCATNSFVAHTCTSAWVSHAKRTEYSHSKFGSNLSCRILKKLYQREQLKVEAPQLLKQLFQMYCVKRNHILKRAKKSVALRCELCRKEVDLGTNQTEICGLGPTKRKYCPRHKDFLCEYPSVKDQHKCYCIMCNKHSSGLAEYFFRIKDSLDFRKCRFQSRDFTIVFKGDY